MKETPDPEKYARMAEPFDSVEQATQVVEAFLNALARLREQYRIPELIVSVMIYAKYENGIASMQGGSGWGDQMKQLQLAKLSFDREYNDAMRLLKGIVNDFDASERLITDPDGKT